MRQRLLRTDHSDDAADGFGFGCREQIADRADHVDRLHRRDRVITDAAADQLAVQRDIVDLADHDHPRPGIAHRRELVETGQHVAARVGLEHDDVRRRGGSVGFDCRNHAAHLDLQVCFCETTVFARGLHRGGSLDGLAERLNRDARRWRDVLLRPRIRGRRRRFVLILARVTDHCPTPLNLLLSLVSGLVVR